MLFLGTIFASFLKYILKENTPEPEVLEKFFGK